jgi:NADH-quinone oxidoreductase subunit M
MSSWPILSLVTFLPLIGSALILSIRGEDETAQRNIRWAALWTTIVTFLVSLLIWVNFDQASPEMQFV